MQKEKMIKLTEDMSSIGYEIVNIKKLSYIIQPSKYGDVEILLRPFSKTNIIFSKDEIIKLLKFYILIILEY